MNETVARFVMLGLIGLAAMLDGRAAESATATDGSGAFATGKYRNLFAEAGHSVPPLAHDTMIVVWAAGRDCFTLSL